jgi:ornithine cyclodeaminase/alanine dehydrogenase-like protein (mu-crystallin family)
MGTKTYATFAGGTRFWVQLFSAETGDLLALIEANKLGQIRTGAATGVAAKHLARADATAAALLGTGWQARSQAEALVAARPGLQRICAFGRDTERRLHFCREMTGALGLPVVPCHSVEDAVRNTQIVVCATTAREPILRGKDHLVPGMFVAAVGANRMSAREIDEEAVGRADVVALDDVAQARTEAAELVFAHEKRRFAWERARPLASIVAGHAPGRTHTTRSRCSSRSESALKTWP